MEFDVQNMTCGSCVRHINEAIKKVDENAKVEADTVARRIKVETVASQQAIQDTLAADGYPAALVA